jgi:hypothetical protein
MLRRGTATSILPTQWDSCSSVCVGLVQIVSSRYDELAMEFVLIDRRLLDWLVGLDTEMNELLEGLNLYTPNVSPLSSRLVSCIH